MSRGIAARTSSDERRVAWVNRPENKSPIALAIIPVLIFRKTRPVNAKIVGFLLPARGLGLTSRDNDATKVITITLSNARRRAVLSGKTIIAESNLLRGRGTSVRNRHWRSVTRSVEGRGSSVAAKQDEKNFSQEV